MTRKRVPASEKKQRHEWAVRQIDAGMGLSELTALTAETGIDRLELLSWSIQTLMAAAGQAKQQKNPGAVVACIKQLDWMTGLGINSIAGSSSRRRR